MFRTSTPGSSVARPPERGRACAASSCVRSRSIPTWFPAGSETLSVSAPPYALLSQGARTSPREGFSVIYAENLARQTGELERSSWTTRRHDRDFKTGGVRDFPSYQLGGPSKCLKARRERQSAPSSGRIGDDGFAPVSPGAPDVGMSYSIELGGLRSSGGDTSGNFGNGALLDFHRSAQGPSLLQTLLPGKTGQKLASLPAYLSALRRRRRSGSAIRDIRTKPDILSASTFVPSPLTGLRSRAATDAGLESSITA